MKKYDTLLDTGLTLHMWDYFHIVDECMKNLTLEHAKFFITCALSHTDENKKFDAFRLLFNLEYFYDRVQSLIKENKDEL